MNSLAKYQQESSSIRKTLLKKRLDFERRINACKQKQENLVSKQKEVMALLKVFRHINIFF